MQSSISDSVLLILVQQIKQDHPNIGEVVAMGEVRSHGYNVTRARLRHAIHV